MSKLAPIYIKYMIRASFTTNGIVEKPDVIGAIFGQSEGLLGQDMDLKELQQKGRIGRINVNIKNEKGKSYGEIFIPTTMDATETALIAAMIETIDRIGPYKTKIKLEGIEDLREKKRKQIIENAKRIVKELMDKNSLDVEKVAEEIKEKIRESEITKYHGMHCGPGILEASEIIIVEGRADVLNLLRYGITNVIAMEGSSVSKSLMNLTKEKTTTAFFDGDRGGLLNLKTLVKVADIDYVAMAPEGKEVEELTKKEVFKALRDKIPVSEFIKRYTKVFKKITNRKESKKSIKISEELKDMFRKVMEGIRGTRAAYIYDKDKKLLGKVPVIELINTLTNLENPYIIVMDGKVDYKLAKVAETKGVKYIACMLCDNIKSKVVIVKKEDIDVE